MRYLIKSLCLILGGLYCLPTYSSIVLTSIAAKAGPGCTPSEAYLCSKDYKVTWQRIPGPNDNDLVPPGLKSYGAMEEHNHAGFYCNNPGKQLFPGVPGTQCVNVIPGDRWRDVEERWLQRYGATGPGIVGHTGRTDSRECVMFAATPFDGAAIGRQQNNGPLVCVGAPPTPDPQCYIDDAAPVISFDVPLGANLTGMTGVSEATLRCRMAANIVVMDAAGNGGQIKLGGGINASLAVNGQRLPLSLRPNPTLPVRFTVSLSGMAGSVGDFRGDFVIVIGYQ